MTSAIYQVIKALRTAGRIISLVAAPLALLAAANAGQRATAAAGRGA